MNWQPPNTLEIHGTLLVFGQGADRLSVAMGISQFNAVDIQNQLDAIAKTESTKFTGIFDTGASKSMVSDRVSSQLNLTVTGKLKCSTAAGEVTHNTHLINVALPNKVFITALHVTSGPLGPIDFLLGMDILNLGDFSIINRDGFKIVEFRMYRPFFQPPMTPSTPPNKA